MNKIKKRDIDILVSCSLAIIAFICFFCSFLSRYNEKFYEREGIVVAKTHYEAYDTYTTQEKDHGTWVQNHVIPEHHPEKYEITIQYYDDEYEKYHYTDIYVDVLTFYNIPEGQKLIYRWDNNTIVKLLEVVNIYDTYTDNNYAC